MITDFDIVHAASLTFDVIYQTPKFKSEHFPLDVLVKFRLLSSSHNPGNGMTRSFFWRNPVESLRHIKCVYVRDSIEATFCGDQSLLAYSADDTTGVGGASDAAPTRLHHKKLGCVV